MPTSLLNQLEQIDSLLLNHGSAIQEIITLYHSDQLGENWNEIFNKQESAKILSDWYNNTIDCMQVELESNMHEMVAEKIMPQVFLDKVSSEGEYYLYDIHPFVLQYILWLYVHDKEFALNNAKKLHHAAIYGTLGYRLVDLDIDEGRANSAELKMMSLLLIQKYEDTLLKCFGVNEKNYHYLSSIKHQFINEEIRQLKCKFKSPCYIQGNMKQMADKAVHLFGSFALGLVRFNKTDQYDAYWNIFRCTFAPIQLLDDISDMKKDLDGGHYSIFWTHKVEGEVHIEDLPYQTMLDLYDEGIQLFNEAREISKNLKDYVFLLNIEKTRLRFNHHFLNVKQSSET